MKGHNKKRNTGLLYEFLVKDITHALVENDQRRSNTSLKILKRHFKPDTVLCKEWKLINSLIKTTVSSESVAASIISEAKQAARTYDIEQLDREKSLLIRNINHRLNDDCFYDYHVNEYRMYATVQSLLNAWRSKNADLSKVALYEQQLLNWLTTKKDVVSEDVINEDAGTLRLLMKVMVKKLNEKYVGVLSEAQRHIVKSYVLSTTKDDPTLIIDRLNETKENLVLSIDNFLEKNPSNRYVNDKLMEVKKSVIAENTSNIDDDSIVRFMLYVKLHDELVSEETL